MKKTFLILLILAYPVFASTEVERTFGLFGGLSLSNFTYNPSTSSAFRKAANLGLDFEFPISQHIFLAPNFYVAQKGEENTEGTVRLNYLEVSFTPKFKTSSDATGLYFLLGPYVASVLSSSLVTTTGAERDLGSNEVRNTEAGLIGGLGFEFLLAHHWTAYLEGKYAMGLTRSLVAQEATNNSIYINLGFHYLDREDLETNFDRAEEFVKRKSDPSNPALGEQSIRPGKQEPFDATEQEKNKQFLDKEAEREPGTSYGLFGGFAFATISSEITTNETPSTKTGTHVGASIDFPISESYTISPNLSYASKGANLATTPVASSGSLNYLEFTLFQKLNITRGSKAFYFMAGPSAAMFLSGNTSYSNGTSETLSSRDFEQFDLSLTAGAGFELSIAKQWGIFIESKYDYSLSNYSKSVSNKYYNRAFFIDIGVRFLPNNDAEED